VLRRTGVAPGGGPGKKLLTGDAWVDTVRIARDLGDTSLLLPDGIDHLADLPSQLFDAVRFALGFLSFDELPKDERPPRNIWMDGPELRKWFKAVERRREEKFGLSKDDMSDQIDGPVEENDVEGILGMSR
jgi:hypothetical protein